MFKGFKQFILRGNAVDLAVGVVFGAAFSGVVNAIVRDLLSPLISVLVKSSELSNFFFTVDGNKFLVGDLINAAISFVLISFAVYFFVVLPLNKLNVRMHGEPVNEKKKCPECLSEIPRDAKRCAFCTAKLS